MDDNGQTRKLRDGDPASGEMVNVPIASLDALRKTKEAVEGIKRCLKPVLDRLQDGTIEADTAAHAQATVALSLGMMNFMGARLRGLDQGRKPDDPLRKRLNNMRRVLAAVQKKRKEEDAAEKKKENPTNNDEERPKADRDHGKAIGTSRSDDNVEETPGVDKTQNIKRATPSNAESNRKKKKRKVKKE